MDERTSWATRTLYLLAALMALHGAAQFTISRAPNSGSDRGQDRAIAATAEEASQKPVSAQDTNQPQDWKTSLRKDYLSLLASESVVRKAELERADDLLESTGQDGYGEGILILRKLRSPSSVPLMICLLDEKADAMPYDLRQMIEIFTGQEARSGQTDSHKTAEELAAKWSSNKASFSVDESKMDTKRLLVVINALFDEERPGLDGHVPRPYLTKSTPYQGIHRLVSTDDYFHRGPELNQSDLDQTMVPLLLELGQPANDRTCCAKLLGQLRAAGKAPQLKLVINDVNQDLGTRICAALSLLAGGESVDSSVIQGMLAKAHDVDTQMWLLTTLSFCSDKTAAASTATEYLTHPNRLIRQNACEVLASVPGSTTTLAALSRILQTSTDRTELDCAMRAVATTGTPAATATLIAFLKRNLNTNIDADLNSQALIELEKVTDRQWTEAGAHPTEYYHDKAREAVRWWESHKDSAPNHSH